MFSHDRQGMAYMICGFGNRGFGKRSNDSKQGQIPVEILRGYASELSEHLLDPAVQIINSVQMVDPIIAFVTNQLNLFTLK